MIDLESALAPLFDNAPEPPAVERVARRGRARRRRRAAALGTTLLLVAAVAAGAIAALTSHRGTPRVAVTPPAADHVRLTLLDGSQLTVSGPASLGLTTLTPAFNGELFFDTSQSPTPEGHSFTVMRDAPDEPGAVVGTHPTADGHQLVVHTTGYGVDAVVQYDPWALVVHWNHDPTDWATFASALDARISADGFLVIEPRNGWTFGPTDAPDLQLGDSYAFWGPATYPTTCPNEAPDHYIRCFPDARVRVGAVDRSLHATLADLAVGYNDPEHETDRITTLDGSTYDITAPSSVLDHLVLQATVAVDGPETPEPIVVEAERTDDPLRIADAPSRLPDAPVTSGDGTELVVKRYPLGDVALQGTYGDWTVDIVVNGLSTADRARVASLFAARETADGFLVLDLRAPMHIVPGPAAEIVLDRASIVTSGSKPRVIVGKESPGEAVDVSPVG